MKTNKLTKLKLTGITMSFIMAISMNGQVTIGSNVKPNSGAILDLKENDQEEANSTKGLNLPRVELVTKNSLAPCLTTVPDNPKAYKGLVVYNVEPTFDNNKGEGIYIWDGGEWVYTPIRRTRNQISK